MSALVWSSAQAIPVNQTPSLAFNNLSWSYDLYSMAYSQRNFVHVVNPKHPDRATSTQAQGSNFVTTVRFVIIEGNERIAVTGTSGIQIWNNKGTKVLAVLSLEKCMKAEKLAGHFCRGVAAISGSQNIAVGTSTGEVLMVYFGGENKMEVEASRKKHTASITDITSSATTIVSADDDGSITVWSSDLVEQCSFDPTGFPCTSIGTRADLIVAGYSSGVLKIFRISSASLETEIDAHCRCVNAIDLHNSRDVFVSGGEDGYINVWSLPSRKEKKISVLYSDHVANKLITGVQFSKAGSCDIAASAYDHKEIFWWKEEK